MSNRRIRSLKPGIVEDEKTGPLSDAAFRLFLCMIVLADDLGHCRADVRWLRNQIWWAHENPPNVLLALIDLAQCGLIEAYTVRGGTYVRLCGWGKHQRVDNAGKMFAYPKPSDDGSVLLTHRDLESLGGRRDLESLAKLDLESPTSRELAIPIDVVAETRGDPPRESEALGSDQDQELGKDQERDQDGESARARANKPRRARRATSPLPESWEPRDHEKQLAVELGVNWREEAVTFRNHHLAKGNLFADWDAAFNNWVRRAKKFADENGRGRARGSQTPFDLQMERVRMLETEERESQ